MHLGLLRKEAFHGIPRKAPGHVLEEGFATMIEEYSFDVRNRTWAPADYRADSLDVVAHAQSLFPWGQWLDMTSEQFSQLAREPTQEVDIRWTLGLHRIVNPVDVCYAQGAALCHYLSTAEGGKYRKALFNWVADLHAGKTKTRDTMDRVGMSASELGEKIEAWARERVEHGAR